MSLVFARHGESEANLQRVISNRGWQHGLTENGREQARQLAQDLGDLNPIRIYTSPLQRAVETSQILSQAWNVPYIITDALREYDCGVLEGKADPESWQRHRSGLEDWLIRGLVDARIEGGESFNDLRRRFAPFIEGLLSRYPVESTHLVLVGHGGLFYTMLPQVLGNLTYEFVRQHPFPNTGTVVAKLETGKLVCESWCGSWLLPSGTLSSAEKSYPPPRNAGLSQ